MNKKKRTPRALIFLTAAVFLAGSCSSTETTSPPAATSTTATATTSSPTTTAVPATTSAPTITTTAAPVEIVDGGDFGPYQVGRSTISLVDSSRDGRTLPVDIWYPVDPAATAEPSVYTFATGIEYTSEHALADPDISGEGPFPVVVYSHGHNGLRYVSAFLTERLASHGFIVVAPDHVGNTLIDAFLGATDSQEVVRSNRLADISFLVSSVVDGTGDPLLAMLASSIDPDNIGMVGHSLGGWTELNIVAGTELTEPDRRIKAVVGLAAFTQEISDDTLASVDVPTLLIGGTLDETAPNDTNLNRPFELISGRPVYRVEIEGAGHQSFTDVCLYQQLLPAVADIPQAVLDAIDVYAQEACTPTFIDWAEAQRIVDTYTIGFFVDQLTDRSDGEPIFTQDFASTLSGVSFTSKS